MSQEELLVTLGVQDKGATTQIRALKNELKYLDSQYKLTASGSKNFEKTTEGLRTKMDYLNKKIEATKTKLQVYKTQMQQAKDGVNQKKEALERLKNAEGDNTTAIKKTEEELNKYKQRLAEATRNVNLTETELKNLENELKETNNAFNNMAITNYQAKMAALSAQLEKTGAALTTFGTTMSALGTKILTAISPLLAFEAYAAKVGVSFEKAMDTVQATSQASSTDMEKLTAKAKEMGENTSKSATDAAEGLNYMALAGWKTEEMLTGIEPILKASVAYNADLGTTSDLATDSLSALGLTAKDLGHYLDIVSNAQSNSNTTGTALMESYIEVGGTFKNLNTTLEESSTLLGVMANRGIKSSEAGTSLNSILINLTKKSGESAEALSQLGISAFDSEGKFKGITVVLRELNEKFKDMTEEQQTTYKSMIAGKTQITGFNALLSGVAEEYDTLYQKQSTCNGALEEMYATMSANTQGKIDAFKSKLEALGIQMADHLLPHINSLLDKLMNLIDWFSNLSSETQESIVKFSAYSLGVGVALKVTGKFVSGIGGLVTAGSKLAKFMSSSTLVTKALGKSLSATAGTAEVLKFGVGALAKTFLPLGVVATATGAAIYAVKEHSEAMNDTVLKSSEEMGVLEKAFTKMAGGTVYTRKELEQMGLVQEKLSDTMSNEFKDAINQATSDVQNFNFELKKIKVDGVITPEEVDGLKSRVSELCDSAISTIDSKCNEIQESLGKAFNSDGVLDDDETKILEYDANWGDKNKAEVTRMQGEINELLRKVREEGYVLTSDDEAKIKNYYAEIQRIELEFQASNNEELLFEKNKFLNRANNLDAESASKMLKERRKYYEEERAEKLAQYDTLINDLSKNLDDMDTETRASAERKIESLKQQKQEQSELLQQYYNEEYEALVNQNKNLEGEIDRYSGEILARKDKQNAEELEKLMSHYAGINEITESGMTRLYNTTTQAYENVYVCVDDVTGKIVGLTTFYANETDISANQVTGATKRIENNMNELSQTAQNDYNNISRALTDTKNTHIDSANQIVNADGRVVGSLREVQTTFGGVKSGIIDINGTPVKIYVDKDGAITNANQIREALNQAARDRTATITVVTKGDTTFLKDTRGNYLKVDGYASGTENATRGVHLVGENGPELVFFDGGEKVLNALNTRNLLSNGGYFNKNTVESTTLYNNYNNSRSNITYNNGVNAEDLSNTIIASVIAAVKNINISLDINKTAKKIDNITGNEGALNRRLNGC